MTEEQKLEIKEQKRELERIKKVLQGEEEQQIADEEGGET